MLKFKLYLTTILATLCLLTPGLVSAADINKTNQTSPSLQRGLVGWYTFDGEDVNATQVLDKSGNSNTGTRTAVTMATGKVGQAGRFNGSSGYASKTSPSFINDTQGTISGWFRINSLTTAQTLLAGTVDGATDDELRIDYRGDDSGKVQFVFLLNGAVSFTGRTAANTIVDKKWHFITVTSNGSTVRVYIDGVAKPITDTVTGTNSGQWFASATDANIFAVGATKRATPVQYYNGFADDIRIYNRALSALEIRQLYQEGSNLINKTVATTPNINKSLRGWWTFDGADTNATQVLDKSGQGNNATRSVVVKMATGKIGQAGKFNGNGTDYVSAPYAANLKLGNAGSVSFWAKFTTFIAGTHGIITYGAGSYTTGYLLNQYGNDLYVYWMSGGPTLVASNFFVGATNKWVYITVTNNNGAITIYKNGTLFVGGGTSGGSITSNYSTDIGGGIGGVNGSLDDVRIYNRALSAKEIYQLYQMGAGTKTNKTESVTTNLNSGLQGWWTFDGAGCDTTYCTDKSGNGNTGQRAAYQNLYTYSEQFDNAAWFKSQGSVTANTIANPINGAVDADTWTASAGGNYHHVSYYGSDTFKTIAPVGSGPYTFSVYVKRNNNDWIAIAAPNNQFASNAVYFNLATGAFGTGGGILGISGTAKSEVVGGGWYRISVTIPVIPAYGGATAGFGVMIASGDGGNNLSAAGTEAVYVWGAQLNNFTIADPYVQTVGSPINTGVRTTMVPGKIGQGIKLDGAMGYVQTAAPVTTAITNVSLSAWFKTNNAAQAGQLVVYNGSDAGANGYGWAVNKEGITNGDIYMLYGGIFWFDTGIAVRSNIWHHGMMVIQNDGSPKFYLDGVLIYTGAVRTRNTPTAHTEIGRNDYATLTPGTARHFNGSIDDVRIYNRALSAKEITQLYQMGK